MKGRQAAYKPTPVNILLVFPAGVKLHAHLQRDDSGMTEPAKGLRWSVSQDYSPE